jgi:hypothetical protein
MGRLQTLGRARLNETLIISQFNKLNGKRISVTMLRKFVATIDKQPIHGPVVVDIRRRLSSAIEQADKSGYPGITPKFSPVKMPVKKALKKSTSRTAEHTEPRRRKVLSNGPCSAASMPAGNYKRIDLTGKFKTDLVRMNSDTQIMVWGSPGEGKTGYCLQLANSLAKDCKMKVLYVASEEYGRSTFTEKLEDLRKACTPIDDKNLFFHGTIDGVDLKDYDVIFLDSVQRLGMDLKDYIKFNERTPGKIKVAVIQSTKDGDFRGGKDWEHEMDIAGEVINRKLVLRKNRLDSALADKKRKREISTMVEKQREKKMISDRVKKGVKKLDKTAEEKE